MCDSNRKNWVDVAVAVATFTGPTLILSAAQGHILNMAGSPMAVFFTEGPVRAAIELTVASLGLLPFLLGGLWLLFGPLLFIMNSRPGSYSPVGTFVPHPDPPVPFVGLLELAFRIVVFLGAAAGTYFVAILAFGILEHALLGLVGGFVSPSQLLSDVVMLFPYTTSCAACAAMAIEEYRK